MLRTRKAHCRQTPEVSLRSGSQHLAGNPPGAEHRPIAVPLGIGLAVLASFAWAYWPTLRSLISVWEREPDYSHGFLVAPLAAYFLWTRRGSFPGFAGWPEWGGIALLALSVAVRVLGRYVYIDAVDAYSMLLWLSGATWLLGGKRVLWWSLPAIAFLGFMVPLPYRVERWFSLPLQRMAATASAWTLQCLGEPAIREGNTILLGEFQLQVEEACSGLRIFMGIVALAFAYLILVRRSWWEKVILLMSVGPIAIVTNALRIVVTALLYRSVSFKAGQQFAHDAAGWAMLPLAAVLFAAVLWYLSRSFRTVEVLTVRMVLRESRA